MTVLIAKKNCDIVSKFFPPKQTFTIGGKNTTTFQTSYTTFVNAYRKIKAAGYNPYALMHW